MDVFAPGLTSQERAAVHEFIRKLRHIKRRSGGKTHLLTVQLNGDGTAVFWHGVPAGIICNTAEVDGT